MAAMGREPKGEAKATAIKKTEGTTKSMLEKVKPVVAAAAAQAKGKPFQSETSVSSDDWKRWKGKMAAGDFALLERFSPCGVRLPVEEAGTCFRVFF